MTKTVILSLLLFLSFKMTAQDAIKLVEEGIAFHDKGEFDKAIDKYKAAAKIDSKSGLIYYEMALSYYSLKDYKSSIKNANKAIKNANNRQILLSAYLIKGAAYDDEGNSKKSIKTYEKAIKDFPENYLLQYNIGFSYFNNDDFKSAEKHLKKAVQFNPKHNTSHLLLAYSTQRQGLKVQPLLALTTFLYLENVSQPANVSARSQEAFRVFKALSLGNVKSEGSNSININVFLNEEDGYAGLALLLSLTQGKNKIEADSANLSTNERLQVFMNDFSEMLVEPTDSKSSFWNTHYAVFIKKLREEKLIEAFTNIMLLSSKEGETIEWLNANKETAALVERIFNRHYKTGE